MMQVLCLHLALGMLVLSCFGNRPGKPGAKDLSDNVKPLEAVSFDAEKQNQIFRDIVQSSQAASCEETQQKSAARLVNANEYVQSIEFAFELDLDDKLIKQALPTETVALLGYDHLRQFNVISAERLASYMSANAQVAKLIAEKKPELTQCGRPAQECLQDWLTNRLPILWRQPIDSVRVQTEIDRFDSLGGDAAALVHVVERLLLSPHFLFRQQLGLDGALSSWELAGLMADVLWGLPPSTELVQLASSNGLNTSEALKQQARSMIGDARFQDGLKRFTGYWLATGGLDRKDFVGAGNMLITDAVKTEMKDEAAAFLYFLVRSEQDQFAKIFSADFTVGSNAYATLFGLTPTEEVVPGLPVGLRKLGYPAERAGLISQPGMVAIASNLSTTNVPLRGKNVMEKFLCQTLKTPENLATIVANVKFDKTVSVHDAFEKSTMVGSCGDCHKLVNGIGYGMENVGSDGRMQPNDNHGFPVLDPQGSFFAAATDLSTAPTTFSGVAGLSRALGTSKEAEACLAVQVFRLVYARLEEREDVCTIVNAYKNASASGLELDALLTEMIVKRSRLAQ